MVEAHPRRAARGVEHDVQKRPVGDGVTAVQHALRLAIGARDGAAVQVIAADDDGCADLPLTDPLGERQSELRSLAEFQPTDSGG